MHGFTNPELYWSLNVNLGIGLFTKKSCINQTLLIYDLSPTQKV